MPDEAKGDAIEIGLLNYLGAQAAMIHGMTDLLETASSLSIKQGGIALRVTHWGRHASGAIVPQDDAGGNARPLDIIIVPGRLAGPLDRYSAAPFARWLEAHHARGAILASSCAGAFLLAETGLLAGRPATTHWMFATAFRKRFPDVDMDADKIVIDDGDIVTAGGLMAWTDLGMRLIERLLGQSVMIETGQFFLIDTGGREQRHYSKLAPDIVHGDDAIALVQAWLRQNGARDVSVADMAEKAGMEERTFLRHFKAATGTTPREYAQRMKFDRARRMLQTTRRPVSRIAWDIGYGDAAAFGRQFHRFVGLSPGEYRRRFAVTGDRGPTE